MIRSAAAVALPLLPAKSVGPSILILEDEPVLRRQIERAFSGRGYDVVATTCVAGFLAATTARAYDACLMDLWLPDGNGLDAWERARPSQHGAVAVVMSAQPTDEAEARARQLGCAAFLPKPFDLSALLALYSPNFSMR